MFFPLGLAEGKSIRFAKQQEQLMYTPHNVKGTAHARHQLRVFTPSAAVEDLLHDALACPVAIESYATFEAAI
ncbi:MAG: hypothetical protein MK186_14515 [Henriciella sp.]|nr:hypothetical protein [Henriciella sp.]